MTLLSIVGGGLRRRLHAWLAESPHYRASGGFPDWFHLERGLVRVQGPDAARFLQGLCSSDVYGLTDDGQGQPSAFLNHRGRCLFDMFLYRRGSNEYWLECQRPYAEDLVVHMLTYRLKAEVAIEEVTSRFRVLGSLQAPPVLPGLVMWTRDGRCDWPLHRLIVAEGSPRGALGEREGTRADYRTLRCVYGVAEGFREMRWAEHVAPDLNLDIMRAVHFNKGCYVGQELVNRAHAKGIVRKRILPVQLFTVDEYLQGRGDWRLDPLHARLAHAIHAGDAAFAMRFAPDLATGSPFHVNMQVRPAQAVRVEGNVGLVRARLDICLRSPLDHVVWYDQHHSQDFYIGRPCVPAWWPPSTLERLEMPPDMSQQ